MKVVETLDGTTYELTVMDAYSGVPSARRLILRRDGVHLHHTSGRLVWSHPWSKVRGARHDATNVWLVGPNDGFVVSVDAMGLSVQDNRAICAELARFQERYGQLGSGGETEVDPRILFLRDQARARNS